MVEEEPVNDVPPDGTRPGGDARGERVATDELAERWRALSRRIDAHLGSQGRGVEP